MRGALVVAGIILEFIEEQEHEDERAVQSDHLQAFVDVWEELDENGSGFIAAHKLTALLMGVPPPMGVKGLDRSSEVVQNLVLSVDIPLR